MSPDKLEKYMLEHRQEFDDMEPDPSLWERIDTRKAPVIRPNWMSIGWKVAAGVAIFIASYFFHDYMSSRNNNQESFMAGLNEEASPIARELIEAEAYYTARISYTKDEVFRLAAADPDLRREVDLQMVDLDRVFTELKEDLKDNAANEEVIEAMIQNYRLKLDILEDMLRQLKESKEPQNDTSHDAAIEL
ncbi:MAG TPA: hypothetical protein PKM34_06475 [Bacteroidales bacterium]|nr:hypothetical protein [Bacteroidales bacterium]HNQ83270.1 hypothetical protein [Bacteroidales bacterium]HPM92484.1 hypothetical protein [Bacteroidales bacterium]